MFFNLPPLKVGKDGEQATISLLSARQDDDGTTNFDIVHVTTQSEGETLTTHFGIQGRSDHLADVLGQRESNKQTGDAPAAA